MNREGQRSVGPRDVVLDHELHEFIGEAKADLRVIKHQLATLCEDHARTKQMVQEHRTGLTIIRWVGGTFLAVSGAVAAWWFKVG